MLKYRKGMSLIEVIIAGTISTVLGVSLMYFLVVSKNAQKRTMATSLHLKNCKTTKDQIGRYLRGTYNHPDNLVISDSGDSIDFYSTIAKADVTLSYNSKDDQIELKNNSTKEVKVITEDIDYFKLERIGSAIRYTAVYDNSKDLVGTDAANKVEMRSVVQGYATPRQTYPAPEGYTGNQ